MFVPQVSNLLTMPLPCKLYVIASVVALATVLHTLYDLIKPLPAPQSLNDNQYWGPGPGPVDPDSDAAAAVLPKRIHYEPAVIGELRRRLLSDDSTEYHPAMADAARHAYGIDTSTLLEFVHYWATEYLDKWPEREQFLNQLPHYETDIQGLVIETKPTNRII